MESLMMANTSGTIQSVILFATSCIVLVVGIIIAKIFNA